jgi:hypothetical protein
MGLHISYAPIIFFLLVCSSCKKEVKENEKMVSISQITSNYDSLIYKVMIKGDSDAYDELFYGFMDSNKTERTDSVLRYSRIMAENFKYERAYFDYLNALLEKSEIEDNSSNLSEIDLTKLDDSSKEAINDWLNQMLQSKIITQEKFDSIRK